MHQTKWLININKIFSFGVLTLTPTKWICVFSILLHYENYDLSDFSFLLNLFFFFFSINVLHTESLKSLPWLKLQALNCSILHIFNCSFYIWFFVFLRHFKCCPLRTKWKWKESFSFFFFNSLMLILRWLCLCPCSCVKPHTISIWNVTPNRN